jgi:HEAT repeat protein
MRVRLLVTLAIILSLMVAAIFWLIPLRKRSDEPRFAGRRLTELLEDYDFNNRTFAPQSEEALKALGTNAVPRLIELLSMRDSLLRRKVMGNRLNFRMGGIRITSAHYYHQSAVAACGRLGVIAEGAVPHLVQLLNDGDNCRAHEALTNMGPAVVTPVMELLNRHTRARAAAIGILGALGESAEPAVLRLVEVLRTDSDVWNRARAAIALSEIKMHQDVVVPALISGLEASDVIVRRFAAISLAEFGPTATSAIPHLVKALASDDADLARVARISLKKIDPASVANVEK